MTDALLAATAHIPDAEVRQDIADTLAEIRFLKCQVTTMQEGIAGREAFVTKCLLLLEARRQAAEVQP
jgi:hypothetical protein